MRRMTMVGVICIALPAMLFSAQQNLPPAAKTIQAVRVSEQITIDGKLEEKIWQEKGFCDFIQLDPENGGTPSEKTEVWIAYDETNLYVAAMLHDSEPAQIRSLLCRRDDFVDCDWIFLFLDAYYDRRSGYRFGVNPAGCVIDSRLYNDVQEDFSWDAVWEGKSHLNSQGWSVEMRIPLDQLRFPKKESYTWGIDFRRIIKRKNERTALVWVKKDENVFVSRFAPLTGLQGIHPKGRLEAWPYLVGQAAFTPKEEGNPFQTGRDFLANAGVDLKFRLKSNLTLDATINPDFGQVEVDPAQINLSAYETYYEEKRPFFIEGAEQFNGFGRGGIFINVNAAWPNPTFFYSRRIGRFPQGEVSSDGYVLTPGKTDIIGAFKLTGKLGNHWNLGWINALTSRESAQVDEEGRRFREEVEPFSYYGVFRLQRDFQEGRSGIGFMSTLVVRDLRSPTLGDLLNKNAGTLALDGWHFLDKKKIWVIGGWIGGTRNTGTREAILEMQKSSLHYFQRPDADHVQIDPQATSLSGWGGRFILAKQQGKFICNLAVGILSPGFDCNDAGFQFGGSDRINTHAFFAYQWTKPGKLFRSASVVGGYFRNQDFGGNRTDEGGLLETEFEFLNYWWGDISVSYNPSTLSNNLTRGGPLVVVPSGFQTGGMIRSDTRKKVNFQFHTSIYSSPGNHERTFHACGLMNWKPISSISLSIGPRFDRQRSRVQWVDRFDDEWMTDTFGARYVFGRIDQKILATDIRLNWIFNPKLSLQLYLQPYIAVGKYDHFQELAHPKTNIFHIYGQGDSTIIYENETYTVDPDSSGPAPEFSFENPDFNYKSLRGTVVLRWEYRPGSLLYFVWTQNREDETYPGELRFGRDLRKIFSTPGDNIFMIKFTYRWNM